jgi:hypothetical protein
MREKERARKFKNAVCDEVALIHALEGAQHILEYVKKRKKTCPQALKCVEQCRKALFKCYFKAQKEGKKYQKKEIGSYDKFLISEGYKRV